MPHACLDKFRRENNHTRLKSKSHYVLQFIIKRKGIKKTQKKSKQQALFKKLLYLSVMSKFIK